MHLTLFSACKNAVWDLGRERSRPFRWDLPITRTMLSSRRKFLGRSIGYDAAISVVQIDYVAVPIASEVV